MLATTAQCCATSIGAIRLFSHACRLSTRRRRRNRRRLSRCGPATDVVYRFEKGEKINLDDPTKIVTITDNEYYKLPYVDGKKRYTYVVTSLDRMSNESKAVKKKLKL